MPTSTDRDEGTSNADRIGMEVRAAADELDSRFPGYQELLANAAIECFELAAEHFEQRIHINQKYDHVISALARRVAQQPTAKGER